jgi:ribosomal protein S18 acetylase RimI-like enzyme
MLEKTENENYFVAKVNGKVVGFCFVTKNEERNQLSAIYILPEFQGKGLGKSLWESASSFIDTSKDTFVDVVTYNTQAIEFYKKLGFVDTGRRWSEEKFKMKSGGVLPEMEMVIRANKSFTTTSIA